MILPSKTTHTIGRRALLGAAGGAMLAAPAVRAQGAAGVALVIGNSKYRWEAPLPNVRRDAPDIAQRFQAMGLKTELLQDVGLADMRAAVERFAAAARGVRFAAFYFAGHGAAWGRDTYLVPVDTDLGTPNVVHTLLPVTSATAAAAGAANRLMIFDNCRNNPADGWAQRQAEWAAVASDVASANTNLPPNTLMLYSTAAGHVALDGPPGENSPFASALLRQLVDGPTIDLRTLAPRLRRDLLIATEARQVLWDVSTYQGSVTLKGARSHGSASSSGWARDPSRIIELDRAYAFARENNLPLPQGLIAHRSARNSPDAMMVGAFKYTSDGGSSISPQLLIVMSVEAGRNAEIIVAGNADSGRYWRFITADIAGGWLQFTPREQSPIRRMFKWNDATSGTFTEIFGSAAQVGKGPISGPPAQRGPGGQGFQGSQGGPGSGRGSSQGGPPPGGKQPRTTTFTRLDG